MTTTGLLKGELRNAHKKRLPIEAWVRETCIGTTTISTGKDPSAKENNSAIEFEISVDMQKIPTDWLIVPDSAIALKLPGRDRWLGKRGWLPGKKEAEAFRNHGIRRILSENKLNDLPEIAMKAEEPGVLRDVILECLGMAMDTFIATGDAVIHKCVALALDWRNREEGLNNLVIERNAYLCATFAALSGHSLENGWGQGCLTKAGLLDNQERICECLVESMPTAHLECERELWKNRIELITGSMCYRLYMTLVENPSKSEWSLESEIQKGAREKGDIGEVLTTVASYIYTCHTKSSLGFLFHQLSSLLAEQPPTKKDPTEQELQEVERDYERYHYEQAALHATRIAWWGGRSSLKRVSEKYGRILKTIQLVLSGYDYADHFQAFSEIAKGQLAICWQVPSGTVHRKVLQNELYQYTKRVRNLASSLASSHCPITEARAFERQCLDRLEELSGLFYVKSPNKSHTQRDIVTRQWLILGSRDLPQCWIYRVRQKKEQLERQGHQVRVLGKQIAWKRNTAWSKHILWADAIIVCRAPYTFSIATLYALARSLGKKIYYEVDDVIFSRDAFPPPLETYGHTITETTHRKLGISIELYRKCMELSDGCIVSTEALKRQVSVEQIKAAESVVVLPNLMLPELREFTRSTPATQKERVRIVFASGTLAHKQSWNEELAPALADVMRRREHVELLLLGSISIPSILQPYKERVIQIPFQGYTEYLQAIATGDIGLSVLESNIATDCKSAIKWMEYSICGLASIVSPSDTHTRLLSAGTNVLFARGTEEWVSKIEFLVNDSESREEIASHAKRVAIEQFGENAGERYCHEFIDWASIVSRDKRKKAARDRLKKRLLVVNVFFRPESHGGATRVAEQQAFAIGEELSESHEVTVLCQDECQDGLERLSTYCHHINGIRIVRIALPFLEWSMHWNRKTSAPLTRLLHDWYEAEDFDLIHAHCLQVLTTAPLVAAKRAGIPYVVSLHDAWWLSPHQFLTTDDGRQIDPKDPTSHLEKHSSRTAVQRALLRRSELMSILESAVARMAVSSVFQQLYESCGVKNVCVLNNPHTTMAKRSGTRAQTKERRIVRACFIGGVSAHKGYFVLREALLRSSLKKLSLDIVDHRIHPEDNRTQTLTWGEVSVRFIPKVPMGDMALFYQSYDLLIAPSTWPESFGLVVREAMSAGLWVVASDIGALAEDIVDGTNGYRVPPANWAILQDRIQKSVQMLLAPVTRGCQEDRVLKEDAGDVGIEINPTGNDAYVSLINRYCKP